MTVAFAGCSSGPVVPPPADLALFNRQNIPAAAKSSDLNIAPLDQLEIKVFGVASLDGTYQVDPQGQIKMPLVGVVQAGGLTIFDLAKQLETKLAQGYLQNPQVSIRFEESTGSQMTIEGAVAKPGMYPVRGPLTLLQAVAVAGGPTDRADPRRVVIFRQVDGKRMAGGFDLTQIRADKAPDPPVFGSDIIVIDGSGIVGSYSEFLKSVPLLGLFVAVAG